MSDVPQQVRDLLFLVSYLRKNPAAPLRDVAKLLKVPPEEVVSYVQSLVLCGKPPFSPGDFIDIELAGGKLHLQLDQKLGRPLRFTPQEAVALTIALRTIAESKAERFSATARALLQKTRSRLGEDIAKKVEEIQPRIGMGADANEIEERLRALQRAVEARTAVDVVYYTVSRDDIATRRLHPYLTVQHAGVWYVVAHDERSSQVRVFRVDRFGTVTTTDVRFTVPSTFDPSRYRLSRMFLPGQQVREARVLLRPPAAGAFVDRWKPRKVEARKAGAVEVVIDYVSPAALAAWLLPYGPLATVLDPPEVREALLSRARALRDAYR